MQASAPQTSSTQQLTLHRGIVKHVLSGDAVIIRGTPRGGPPPEKQLNLSNIIAPRLARRPVGNDTEGTKDEPWAWESREFLRKKVVGKDVTFSIEYKVPASGREYGCIYLGKDMESDNVSELLVAEGLVDVRQAGNRPNNDYLQKLDELQNQAKTAGKGKWGSSEINQQHVRDITWAQEHPRSFVDSLHQEPQQAVIEHVRDGSTFRAFLTPAFNYVTVMLSGLKCPGFKIGDGGKVVGTEPFAEEAKFFCESRLLQRDVEIILESVSNQNYIGSVVHPAGNISELLLKEGYAKCVDWSMTVVTGGAEPLRNAEKSAKEKRVRLWREYTIADGISEGTDKSFTAKVTEIVNGDAIVVKKGPNEFKKIWLSSIRPPRQDDFPGMVSTKEKTGRQFRPLYDIPFMFEAREFLRKKLIGKKVNVTIDYVQEASEQFPERTCCTVVIGGQNVAEALVAKGLCTVVRYRAGEDKRSLAYDTLLSAEDKAKKSKRGIHSLMNDPNEVNNNMAYKDKDPPIIRVQELQGDYSKSKQFLPYLQRAGRSDGVVEFVASGSRVRLFVPKETCLITFLISGINCPRGSRPDPRGSMMPAEPFGEEATRFTKELCMQREVEFEVETMDKAGNFVGYLFVDGINLAVALVDAGLASVHFTAERSKYYSQLTEAEGKAKEKKLKVWENYEEQAQEEADEKDDKIAERAIAFRAVVVTEVLDNLHFYVQYCDQGPKLEQMMVELRTEFSTNAPLPGAYTPKRGDICAAKFTQDGLWYRARVESVKGPQHVEIHFMDFGNRETTTVASLATLPSTFVSYPPGAHEFALAFVQVPNDVDYAAGAVTAFQQEAMRFPDLLMNAEFRTGGVGHVTLQTKDREDIGKRLVADGFLMAEPRREARFQMIVADYLKAQEAAKKSRVNIWRYGDFTGDEL